MFSQPPPRCSENLIIGSCKQVQTDSSTSQSEDPNNLNQEDSAFAKISLNFSENHKIKLQQTDGHHAHS